MTNDKRASRTTKSVILALIIAFVALLQRLRSWWRSRVEQRSTGDSSGRISIPFYERFVELMAARGFHRGSSQTAAEFADDVAHRLVGQLPDASGRELPQTLATLFYQVRYGETLLNPLQQGKVDQAMEYLERLPQETRS